MGVGDGVEEVYILYIYIEVESRASDVKDGVSLIFDFDINILFFFCQKWKE